jgi:predicted permease
VTVDRQPPFAIRLHARLVRLLIPSLGPEFADQVTAAFRDLYVDPANAGIRKRVRLWSRELRSLCTTSFGEYRERRDARRGNSSRPSVRPVTRHPGRGFRTLCDNVSQDLRYAARSLARTPGFALVVVLSLTLGMSVSTALFSLVNTMLFRLPPHVESPHELVRINVGGTWGPTSYPDFVDFRDQIEALEDAAAFGTGRVVVTVPERPPRSVTADAVSENYFDVLGVSTVHGRSFVADDGRTADVVVIGYGFWQREFGGDPEVLGRRIGVDGREHTIVGVAEPGLIGLVDPVVPDLWYPVELRFREMRNRRSLGVIGRLKDGMGKTQVQSQADLIAQRLQSEYPADWVSLNGEPIPVVVRTLKEGRMAGGGGGDEPPAVAILAILVTIMALILGIACSNVANLMLTRAQRRRTEIAVRVALGAGRGRLVSQLLTESLILAGAAGASAFLVIHWVTALLASGQLAMGLPATVDFTVDWRVAVFTAVVALGTGIVFGLVPALQASRPDLVPALKGLGGAVRGRFFGVRHLLVMIQVAGSLILLVGATLFLRSLAEAGRADLGFDPENVAVISVDLAQRQYTPEAGEQFYSDVIPRLSSLPGVESVAIAMTVLLGPGRTLWGLRSIEGYEPAPGETIVVDGNVVTPGYFDLVRMPLVMGRDFTDRDRDGAPEVIIVNETFVDRYFGGENPLGRGVGSREVVGVVRDATYERPGEPATPHLWLSYAQHPELAMRVHIRTAANVLTVLPALVREVQGMDPALPILEPSTMKALTAEATLPQRIMSMVLGVTGVLALGMAMMGIYGVMAFAVSQRTREVGLRVALGAHPGKVVRMIVKEGLLLSGTGLLVGLGVAALLTRALSVFLYGVSPLDPTALLGGLGMLLAASVAATLVPALRAAQVDPMESLRAE